MTIYCNDALCNDTLHVKMILCKYVIRGETQNWFKNYLSERHQ